MRLQPRVAASNERLLAEFGLYDVTVEGDRKSLSLVSSRGINTVSSSEVVCQPATPSRQRFCPSDALQASSPRSVFSGSCYSVVETDTVRAFPPPISPLSIGKRGRIKPLTTTLVVSGGLVRVHSKQATDRGCESYRGVKNASFTATDAVNITAMKTARV
nr:hypothetical protein CFP56_04425 [Quercus suber]